MQIAEKEIKELKPYENNPRNNNNAVKYVANSIQEFGFKVPIIVGKDNVIVAGHTRYKAAKKLNLKKVPCIIADKDREKHIKALKRDLKEYCFYKNINYKLLLSQNGI